MAIPKLTIQQITGMTPFEIKAAWERDEKIESVIRAAGHDPHNWREQMPTLTKIAELLIDVPLWPDVKNKENN